MSSDAGFDRFLGVDWSGAKSGGNVFVAEVVSARRGHRLERLERSSRERVETELVSGGPGRRTLAGLDFCFSFPTAFEIGGRADWDWPALRAWASGLVAADPDVRAALSDSAERPQFRLRSGDPALALLRRTERVCRPLPASVMHLVPYQRQVCLGSLHGIAMIDRLHDAPGVAVWPFDDDGEVEAAHTVLAEAYPAMWVDPGVAKRRPSDRLRQVREWQAQIGGIDAGVIDTVLDSEDAFDALAIAVALPGLSLAAPPGVDPEGWILGVEPGA